MKAKQSSLLYDDSDVFPALKLKFPPRDKSTCKTSNDEERGTNISGSSAESSREMDRQQRMLEFLIHG